MPQQTTTPVRTPVEAPATITEPNPKLLPGEICPQQKREMASPDISP
jgi:hypothetical protein